VTASAESVARAAQQAAAAIATTPTAVKNACLADLAARLEAAAERIASANAADLAAARAAGQTDAKLRRLTLTPAAIAQMAAGVRQIAALPDPVGQVTRDYTVPSGLRVRKVRCPLGVILMIYEARPNVTIDAFALCFKAGNACILKGGHEAARSNAALLDLIHESLAAHALPAAAAHLLTTSDRDQIKELLKLEQYIDLVIPRGGTELIRFVHEHARIPTVQHFQGVCHIFVDETADLAQALSVCTTAKTSAPATCNAVEAVLVHQAVALTFVPQLVQGYASAGVEVRGDEHVCALAPQARPAAEADWGREFLDLIVAVRVVPDLEAAVAHIHRYGSNHTEAILSRDPARQREFTERVQSSCVLVNASPRFNDGFQLGLGAEIGISTSKIHAYGPMGLEELTAQRYVVYGAGQTR
jgi:glutamate-5-semialdehyde dehydrogenase